jgi:hypothetical protein
MRRSFAEPKLVMVRKLDYLLRDDKSGLEIVQTNPSLRSAS